MLLETREQKSWSWDGCWRKLLELLELTKHCREKSKLDFFWVTKFLKKEKKGKGCWG